MTQPPFGPRPAAKKNNGCLIALAIVGGLFLVIGGVIAFGVYKFATSKEGQTIIAVVGDGAKIIHDAQTAPGTKELRKLGCKQAMVLDMDKLKTLTDRFDAGAPPAGEMALVVTCQAALFGTPPSCDDVARTYLGAAGPPDRRFAVTVQSQSKGALCSSLYDPGGTKVSDINPGSAPTIPGGTEE